MTVSTEEEVPVEVSVALARSIRVALVHGHEARTRASLSRIALASGAEIALVTHAADGRAFVELAQAFRDASPAAVLVAGDARDARAVTISLEALRLGCAAQEPRPRVFAVCDPRVAERLRAAAHPFAFETLTDEAAAAALRAERRGANVGGRLRDEVIEDAARALAGSTRHDALVVDVSDRTTSCVLARPSGAILAAHVAPLGLGAAADRVVVHAGVDRVRRWIPWAIDAPALLERVYNRARWEGAVPASDLALAIDMAIAREAIAHALRVAIDAGLDGEAIRAAPSVLITGGAAAFPRPAQSLLVLVDGLEPTGLTAVWREPDEGRAERVGLVAAVWPRRSATVQVIGAAGREEHRVRRGSFLLVPATGAVEVSGGEARGRGDGGALGLLIDARGRPIALPHRDAERLPTIGAWNRAIGALNATAKT